MKLRIFIIDDEESIRETFQWHLESQGHEVVVAEEPLACDIYHGCDCQEEHPCGDILFVDYSMPRMTGLDFIDLMHKRGCKGSPSFKYLMTGNINIVDMDVVKEIGCNVLQKPVTFKEIDEIVEKIQATVSPDRKLTPLTTLEKKSRRTYTKRILGSLSPLSRHIGALTQVRNKSQ